MITADRLNILFVTVLFLYGVFLGFMIDVVVAS